MRHLFQQFMRMEICLLFNLSTALAEQRVDNPRRALQSTDNIARHEKVPYTGTVVEMTASYA